MLGDLLDFPASQIVDPFHAPLVCCLLLNIFLRSVIQRLPRSSNTQMVKLFLMYKCSTSKLVEADLVGEFNMSGGHHPISSPNAIRFSQMLGKTFIAKPQLLLIETKNHSEPLIFLLQSMVSKEASFNVTGTCRVEKRNLPISPVFDGTSDGSQHDGSLSSLWMSSKDIKRSHFLLDLTTVDVSQFSIAQMFPCNSWSSSPDRGYRIPSKAKLTERWV